MTEVLAGYGVVIVVIAVGYALARQETLGPGGRRALASFVYAVATPALLFDRMTNSEPSEVFNTGFLVVALSALVTGLIAYVVCRLVFRDAVDESIIGMLASSYANGGNLGIPLAAYVLGDASAVIPVMLFQVAFYAPVTLTAIDVYQSRGRASVVHNLVVVPLRNPMLIASLAAIAFSLSPVSVPTLIAEPLSILAGASVPLALVVFGMSLYGARISIGGRVIIACLFKNILHPLIAALIAAGIFGMSGPALYAAVLLGALPTAQNVNTYAIRFRVREGFARDTGLVSTLASLPVLLVISVVLA